MFFKIFDIIILSIFCKSVFPYLNLNKSPISSCYANGSAHQCMPPFINMVENVTPKIETMCTKNGICNSNQIAGHFITDFHSTNNFSCWTSDNVQSNHVNITFSLGKKFEIYYVSLTPCDYGMPNAVAIYKSNDFGKTWIVWHYFATNCKFMFNMKEETHPLNFNEYSTRRELQAKCFPLTLSKNDYESVMAFSTALGGPYDRTGDSQLIEWMTASDIRISLFHFDKSKQNQSNLFRYSRKFAKQTFSIADISIGGRCKCNGHANDCFQSPRTGKLACNCQHNTEGQDCEKCKSNYLDHPWARATANSPAICKKCECNLHSSSCNFSHELYIIRRQLTGGVCTNCQHNTAGTRCHYCTDGYYRDWTKPLDHKYVCKKCTCHPIGAKYKDKCDKRTSQCLCKKGVTGEICNRCLPGYRQTKSTLAPCIRNVQMEPAENKCAACNSRRTRIKFKKFCRKDAVFVATLQSQENIGDFIRFDVTMDDVWHFKDSMEQLYPNIFHKSVFSASMRLRQSHSQKSTYPVWLKSKDLKCSCVQLQLGQAYLFIIKSTAYQYQNRAEILIKSSRSVILKWRTSWKRRLDKFQQKEGHGDCAKFKDISYIKKSDKWTTQSTKNLVEDD